MWERKSHQTPRWDLKVLRKLPHTQINFLLTFSGFVRGPPTSDWVFMMVFRRERVIMLAVLEENTDDSQIIEHKSILKTDQEGSVKP